MRESKNSAPNERERVRARARVCVCVVDVFIRFALFAHTSERRHQDIKWTFCMHTTSGCGV